MFEHEIKRISARRSQLAMEEVERLRRSLASQGNFVRLEAGLKASGARLARAGLEGPAEQKQARAEFDRLRLEYDQELAKLGLNAGDLEAKPQCSRCKDQGYLEDGTLCHCLSLDLPEILPPDLNFFPPVGQNFASFDPDLFSTDTRPDWYDGEISPRQAALELKRFSQEYADRFNRSANNLFFYGDPGTGKSFILSAIGNSLWSRGIYVAYLTADRFFRIMAKRRFLERSFNPDSVDLDLNQRQLELIFGACLLIIDDLGIEAANDANYRELFQVFEQRPAGQVLLIGSNISPDEFKLNYDERLSSRLVGGFELIHLMGDDLRVQAARLRLEETT